MIEINGIKLKGELIENEEVAKVIQTRHNGYAVYPSLFELNQVVQVGFHKDERTTTATIRGIHFYPGKVKYDLGLWLGDGSVDNPESETRIYNIDSYFVTAG